MVYKTLKHFFYYFKEERGAFIVYALVSVVAGVLELCGVALVYPFVLAMLSKNTSNTLISPYFIAVAVILIFLLKNAFMVYYIHLQLNYSMTLEQIIKNKCMSHFLFSRYQDTSRISLSQKRKIFDLLIPNTINNFVLRLLNLNVNLIIFVLIALFLLIKFQLATIVTVTCTIILLQIQNKITKPLLKKYSDEASNSVIAYNESMNDVTLFIKGIKVANCEQYFYNKFKNTMSIHYDNLNKINFLNLISPYTIEPCVLLLLFIMLSIIALQYHAQPDKLFASFALIACAIFRLAPIIARIQINLSGINSSIGYVNELLNLMDTYKIHDKKNIELLKYADFNHQIEIKGLSFGYEKDKFVLSDINFIIKKGEFIGIAGDSGAGKTTLTDLISGLYIPQRGEILIDGKKTENPLKIAYIPQEFKLINATIRENVAFGCDVIDDDKVVYALKQANLYDFINKNYEKGIYENPFIDNTGFSHGQKQRLVIARALYSNSDILILDEATSSLDLNTENEICTVLNELKGKKTIIIIAHRLTTIKMADRIIFMKNGKIVKEGDFEYLKNNSEEFNRLALLSIK